MKEIYALPFTEPVRYYTCREYLETFNPHTLEVLEDMEELDEAVLLDIQKAHQTAKREGIQAIGDAFPAIVWKIAEGYSENGWARD